MLEPKFIRWNSTRIGPLGPELDEIVIAISPAIGRPLQAGDVVELPNLGSLLVRQVWPAGQVPGSINAPTHDVPPGYSVAVLRVPGDARIDPGSIEGG